MKIDGKAIAAEIFSDLTKRVEELKIKKTIPHLVVILVGNDPASESYVRQKDIKTQMIGGSCTIKHLPVETSEKELLKMIEALNSDHAVHGIIVQRPLPKHISSEKIDQSVSPEKDIDAFLPEAPFPMPLAAAVMKILEYIWEKSEIQSTKSETKTNVQNKDDKNVLNFKYLNFDIVSSFDSPRGEATPKAGEAGIRNSNFIKWLQSKNIVVVGKGQTGGGPTINLLKKLGVNPTIIDSKTVNAPLITEEADIIVSTVGRANIVRRENIKKGVILIGVGMYRGEDGKLHGDYEEDDIKDIASYYTPVPGGVGPVNVAMLLKNLIKATERI